MVTRNPNPIVPAEILDPYPERSGRVAGVRQRSSVTVTDANRQLILGPQTTPTPFAASLKTGQVTDRVSRWPVASTLLACLAQTMLAVAMSTGTVPIVIGVSAALSVLVCVLLLIVAQCMTLGGNR